MHIAHIYVQGHTDSYSRKRKRVDTR